MSKRRSPEQRYEAAVQRVEKALLSLGNIQGEFDPKIIAATGDLLRERVVSAVGRIRPEHQLTLFEEIARRALRDEESGPIGEPAPGGDGEA